MIEESELDQVLLEVFKGDEWLRLVDFVFSLACDFTDDERKKYSQLYSHLVLDRINDDNPFKALRLEIVDTRPPH